VAAVTEVDMIQGLDTLLEGTSQPGVSELRLLLEELLRELEGTGRVLDEQPLQSRRARVYRLRFAGAGKQFSLVVKRLEPGIAQRNELVTKRWLPSVGLGGSGPSLLGAAAERSGQCVWHVYEDLGDWALDADAPDPMRVKAAVELIAQVHTRFAEHPLLPECRLYGGDRGIHFFSSNVRDAMRCLEAVGPPVVELSSDHRALRDRLLARLQKLRDGQPARAQALAELGGPETLLHGDLWMTNIFVLPGANGLRARLIDWDHAAVGPASYDLSTFLLRFPPEHRRWTLDLYRAAVLKTGWRLPGLKELNLLFETAELARFANRLIWPAMATTREGGDWGFPELAEVEQWFEDLKPVLCLEDGAAPATP